MLLNWKLKLKDYLEPITIASSNSKFIYLDGLRGICALFVVLHHVILYFKLQEVGYYKLFSENGLKIGVPGFFMLSAFLLTYRLLIDFDRAGLNHRLYLLKIIQYAIRRFLRIYIVYILCVGIFYVMPDSLATVSTLRLNVTYFDALLLKGGKDRVFWTVSIITLDFDTASVF